MLMKTVKIAVTYLVFVTPVFAQEGVIGATCSSSAYCPHSRADTSNACFNVGPDFYPGVLMLAAKEAAIRKCQRANALDYCGANESGEERKKIEAEYSGGCYEQCSETAVLCIFGDNR